MDKENLETMGVLNFRKDVRYVFYEHHHIFRTKYTKHTLHKIYRNDTLNFVIKIPTVNFVYISFRS